MEYQVIPFFTVGGGDDQDQLDVTLAYNCFNHILGSTPCPATMSTKMRDVPSFQLDAYPAYVTLGVLCYLLAIITLVIAVVKRDTVFKNVYIFSVLFLEGIMAAIFRGYACLISPLFQSYRASFRDYWIFAFVEQFFSMAATIFVAGFMLKLVLPVTNRFPKLYFSVIALLAYGQIGAMFIYTWWAAHRSDTLDTTNDLIAMVKDFLQNKV